MPGGRLNVGAGAVTHLKNIKEKLLRFKKKHSLSGKVIERGGGVIPLFPSIFPDSNGAVHFGNSAGMVQPITGEGLKYICRNAAIFADMISKGQGGVNSYWLSSKCFWKLFIASVILRICFCGGNSGMRIYNLLAKTSMNLLNWRRI
jgi:flavin-dependent dehydrogenase